MKLVASIAVLLIAHIASADPKDKDKEKADALFKQGNKLMKEKHYAEACQAFEQVVKLDPGVGALANLATCYRDWGKVGKAYLTYQQAFKLAQDGKDSRADKIEGMIGALEPEVPRVIVKVPKGTNTDGLKVTIDGEPVTLDQPTVVDPGPRMLEYSAPGNSRKNKVVNAARGKTAEALLDDIHAVGTTNPSPTPVAPVADQPAATGRNQRIAGMALGGGGVVAITISTIMTLAARSKYNDALEMYCNNDPNDCGDAAGMGLKLTHEARSTANKATVVFLLGTAMVGGGVALYLLAPKSTRPGAERATVYLAPAVTTSGAGLVLGGRL